MLRQFHIRATTTGAVKLTKILLFLSSANASLYWYLKTWKFFGWLLKCFTPTKPGVLLGAMTCVSNVIKQTRSDALRRKYLFYIMQTAASYEEWKHGASLLEKCSNFHSHKDCDFYDEELIIAKLEELGGCKTENMMFCLRADLVRNLGNICNPEIHQGRLHMPSLIQQYTKEVMIHLQTICASEYFSQEEKIAFFNESRHAFGKTALLLSGGAALGAFHLGVVGTLIQHNLLPRVIAGSSAGSIVGAFTATKSWAELQLFFDDPTSPMDFFESMGGIFNIAHKLFTKGALQDIGALQRQMRKLIGDLTFQEAYDLTGRVLGISVCSTRRHEPPRLLNYLTSPHVVIWSAVAASCAFPGLFEAQELMAKNRQGHLVPYHHTLSHVGHRPWRDGSLENDLPVMKLKELFNVNHFIVSQANPHIAPLLRLKEFVRACGGNFAAKLAQLVLMEVKHRCNQVLELGLGMRNVAQFFAQDWEGDITIVMPATLGQIVRMIQNPTISDLRKAVMQGRRCTWPKLSAIEANCGIELMLDECSFKLNDITRLSNTRNNCGIELMLDECTFKLTDTIRLSNTREELWQPVKPKTTCKMQNGSL